MRFGPVLALTCIVLLPVTAAHAQSSRDACEMLDASLLQTTLGTTSEIAEQSGAGTGISFCHWRGADEQGVRLHSITQASQGIVGGTALEYFEQHATNQVANLGAANVSTIEGPWQSAQMVDVTTEANPQQFYSITFINKDDTVTVETYGLPKQATITVASAVAEAM